MADRAGHTPGADIRLRPVCADDLPALFRMQADPQASRMAVVNPRSPAEFAEHWNRILADRSVVARAILARDDLVGSINCFRMDGVDAVGYWIARDHWGRGIATRALELLLGEVATRPLHARVARSNIGSILVLERNGFRVTHYQHVPADDRFPACEEAALRLD
ncbi:MAG: GNAT family N-acetyltransferase [Phycisphaerales bacterium JB041]